MKISSKILGGIMLALMVLAIICSVICAYYISGLLFKSEPPNSNADNLTGMINLLFSVAGLLLMGVLLGFCLFTLIFAIMFLISYINRIKDRNTMPFNVTSITISIVIILISTTAMIFDFKELWWISLYFIVLNGVLLAYSIISVKEQKNISKQKTDSNDGLPLLDMQIKDNQNGGENI